MKTILKIMILTIGSFMIACTDQSKEIVPTDSIYVESPSGGGNGEECKGDCD